MKAFIVSLLVISALAADASVTKKHEKRGLASYGAPPVSSNYPGGFGHFSQGGFIAGPPVVKSGSGFGGYVYGPPAVNRVPLHVAQPAPFALPHPGPHVEFRRPVVSYPQSAPVVLSQNYGAPVHRAPLPVLPSVEVPPAVQVPQPFSVSHSVALPSSVPISQTFHVSQPVPAQQVAEHHSVHVAQPYPVAHHLPVAQPLPVAPSYPVGPSYHVPQQAFPVSHSHSFQVAQPLPVAVPEHHSVSVSQSLPLPAPQPFPVAPVHHSTPVHVSHEIAQPAVPLPSFGVPSSGYGGPIVGNGLSSGHEVSVSSLPSTSYGVPSSVVHTSAHSSSEVNDGYSYPVPSKKLVV